MLIDAHCYLKDTFFLVITLIYIVDVVIRLFGLGWRSYKADGWNWFDIVVAGGSFITTLIVRSNDFGYVTEQLQKLFLVSIAFKLVQRTNSLNKLFKTAVYVHFHLPFLDILSDGLLVARVCRLLSLSWVFGLSCSASLVFYFWRSLGRPNGVRMRIITRTMLPWAPPSSCSRS